LPLDTDSNIEEELSLVSKLILHPNIGESSLLKKREQLLDFAKRTRSWSDEWLEKSNQLAQILCLP